MTGLSYLVHLPHDRFDTPVVLLHSHLQCHVALHEDLILLRSYLLPEVVEGPLNLFFVLGVQLSNILDVLLELTFLVGQPVNVCVNAL